MSVSTIKKEPKTYKRTNHFFSSVFFRIFPYLFSSHFDDKAATPLHWKCYSFWHQALDILVKSWKSIKKNKYLSCLFYMATSSSARQFLCVLRAIKTTFTWTPSDASKWYVAAPSNIYFVSYLLLLFEVKTQRNEYQLRTMWLLAKGMSRFVQGR